MLYRQVFGRIFNEFRGITRFFVNFAGFRGYTRISRLRDRAKYQKPWYIDASRVKEVLKYQDLIPIIEEALVNFSARESGGIFQPVRTAVQLEDRG